jgi:hypothetical protein
MRPLARKEKLTVRVLPEETLVYDLEGHKLHCLNRTAALVWGHCDGRHDLAALAALLARELGLPAPEATAAARLALEQLGRRGLLQEAVAPEEGAERLTRRTALRKMAVAAAAALPVVMSLKSPSVAWASNFGTCRTDADCPPDIPICQTVTEPGPHLSFKTKSSSCIPGIPQLTERVATPTPAPVLPTNCQGRADFSPCMVGSAPGRCKGGNCVPTPPSDCNGLTDGTPCTFATPTGPGIGTCKNGNCGPKM